MAFLVIRFVIAVGPFKPFDMAVALKCEYAYTNDQGTSDRAEIITAQPGKQLNHLLQRRQCFGIKIVRRLIEENSIPLLSTS